MAHYNQRAVFHLSSNLLTSLKTLEDLFPILIQPQSNMSQKYVKFFALFKGRIHHFRPDNYIYCSEC